MKDDTAIYTSKHGTAFTGEAVDLLRITTLRAGIRLYDRSGILPTRGLTPKKMLAMATGVTGQPYVNKPESRAKAIEDLTKTIDLLRLAIPVIQMD